MATPNRVLLADDHAMFLQGLKALLAPFDEFEIAATAECGENALDFILKMGPDIAVLDGSMSGMGGVEVMEQAREAGSATRFVLLTMFSHPQLLADAREAGATACVSKKDATRELAAAMRAAIADLPYFSRSLLPLQEQLESGAVCGLTRRERETMRAIVAGMSNKEIASLLGISVKTVDTHRGRLMKKIGAHNGADIVRYAMQMGIGML